MQMNNFPITITHDKLPDSKDWKVGETYRVKMVLKQVASREDSAEFEIVDASSLEPNDKAKRKFLLSEGGMIKG